MHFRTLLRATVDGETIYFDGDGMLYEHYPMERFYVPTGRFVYYEYFGKPIFMLDTCNARVWADQFDIYYSAMTTQGNTLDTQEPLKKLKGDNTTQ